MASALSCAGSAWPVSSSVLSRASRIFGTRIPAPPASAGSTGVDPRAPESAKPSGFGRIAMRVSVATIFAQACGFVSSIAIAHLLGANNSTDAYFLALSVPMLVYGTFLAGVRQGAIPALTPESGLGPKAFAKAGSELVSTTIAVTVLLSLVATAVAIAILSLTIGNPALLARARVDAVALTPLGPLGATIASLAAILAVRDRFTAAAIVLAFDPLTRILLLLIAGRTLGTAPLIIANLAGNAVAVVALWVLVRRAGIELRLHWPTRSPFVRRLVFAATPLLISSVVIQANPVVDRTMASSLGSGSITSLELGLRLFAVPMTLIGATLIGPLTATWAKRKEAGGWPAVRDSVNRTVDTFALIVPPILVLGIGLRHQLISLMYQGGAYSAHATRLTAAVFAMFLVGLPAQLITIPFATLFVVEAAVIFIMMTGFVNVLLNVGLNFALRPVLGVSGIALSTSVTYTLVLALYVISARRRWGGLENPFSGWAGIRAALAVGLMAIVTYGLTSTFPPSASRAQLVGKVAVVALAVLVIYGAAYLNSDRRRLVGQWVGQGALRGLNTGHRRLARPDQAEGR